MIFNLITKAKDLFYKNSSSGLIATNVQDAIDEMNIKTTGTYTSEYGSFTVSKKNNVVNIFKFSKLTKAAANNSVLLTMTNSKFIPASKLYIPVTLSTSNSSVYLNGYVEINTSGQVIWHGGDISTSYAYLLNCNYTL